MKTKKVQLSEIAAKLMNIRPNLVRGDIKMCSEETEIGYHTIVNYLRGKPRSVDTAVKVADWFNDLLDSRNENVKRLSL